MPAHEATQFDAHVQRMGIVLQPNDDPAEAEGALNPACARLRSGELVLYPRDVARGNISRIGLVRAHAQRDWFTFTRAGFVLEPEAPYELRPHPGYGCEDPRVT